MATALPFNFLCAAGCHYRLEVPLGCDPDYRSVRQHQASCPWYRFACEQWAKEAEQRVKQAQQPIAAAAVTVPSRKRNRDASPGPPPAESKEPAMDDEQEQGDLESEAAEPHASPIPPVKQARFTALSAAPAAAAAALSSAAPLATPMRSRIPHSAAAAAALSTTAPFRSAIPPRPAAAAAAAVPASAASAAAAAAATSSSAAAAAASSSAAALSMVARAASLPDEGMPPLELPPFLSSPAARPAAAAAAAASVPSPAGSASKFHGVIEINSDGDDEEEDEDSPARAPPSPKAELSNSGRRMRRCGAPVRLVDEPVVSASLFAAQPDCRQPVRKFAKVSMQRMELMEDTQLHYLGQSLPIYLWKERSWPHLLRWLNLDELMPLMVREGLFAPFPPGSSGPSKGSSALQWACYYRDTWFHWTPRCGLNSEFREIGGWNYDAEISSDTRMVDSKVFVTTHVVAELLWLSHLDDDAERQLHDKADKLQKLITPLHAKGEQGAGK